MLDNGFDTAAWNLAVMGAARAPDTTSKTARFQPRIRTPPRKERPTAALL